MRHLTLLTALLLGCSRGADTASDTGDAQGEAAALASAGGDGGVGPLITGFSDAQSGVTDDKIAYKVSPTAAPSSCTSGEDPENTYIVPDESGTSYGAAIANLTNGATYTYRACAVDVAGHVSSGAKVTVIGQ